MPAEIFTPRDLEFFKPFERVSDEDAELRLSNRLSSPKSKEMLQLSLNQLKDSIKYPDHPWIDDKKLYVGINNFAAVTIFGENADFISWDMPINLTEKDNDLLGKVQNISDSVRSKKVIDILRDAQEIPIPFGTKCDRGDFVGFNQEVLIHCSSLREDIKRFLMPKYLPTDKDIGKLADSLFGMVSGFRASDRDLLTNSEAAVMEVVGKVSPRDGEGIISNIVKKIRKKNDFEKWQESFKNFEKMMRDQYL